MTSSSTSSQFVASLPTILIGGQEQAALKTDLQNLLIVEDIQGLYRCELTINNWGNINNRVDFLYFDRRIVDFGKQLEIKLADTKIFDGRIMALEAHFTDNAPPTLTILAEDRFQDLRMTRRTRSFDQVSDADVLNRIASDHHLAADIRLTGPTYKLLAQVNQSDLAFARERARAMEAELWLEGSTLHVCRRSDRNGATLDLAYGSGLREFRVTADLAGQRNGVIVTGWDVSAKDVIKYEAGDSVIGSELGGDQSGVSILRSALAERKETLAQTVPLASDEAQAVAEAYYRMAARRFVVGHGLADADSRLRAGAHLNLTGLGPLFSGKYYVTEIRTTYDLECGLRTEFTVERPGIGRG
jgi:phage protein D